MARWLLIDDGPSTGARNMAVDEFLLRRADNGGGAPVLRLYSFRPPAITLGYHQDAASAIDLEAASSDGIDVVRRITGGRALLHAGELTYSVTAPLGPPFDGTLSGTFLAIAGVIVSALGRSGVRARIGGGRGGERRGMNSSPCLASAGRHEITAGGRKISGSAQRRMRRAFIQHGSILLRAGSERIERYLPYASGSLAGTITTVEAEAGLPDGGERLRGDIIDLFGDLAGGAPEKLVLSDPEMAEIERAASGKATGLPAGKADR
jgi:lipoate-protein ligase A